MITLDEILKYKYAIFDMDGTLIESEPLHLKAWCDMAEKYGFPPLTYDFLLKIGGMPTRDVSKLICEQHGLKISPDELTKSKYQCYLDVYMDQVKPFPEIIGFLKALIENGAKVCVATGSLYPESKYLLDKFGVFPLLSGLISADMVEHGKPAPDTYLKAAACLNADPKEVLVFEDTELGLKGIKAAGMSAVKVLHGKIDCDNIIRP